MAPLLTAQDLERMLAATGGEPVVLGADETVGHLDAQSNLGRDEQGLEYIVHERSVVVPAGLLTGLAVDAVLTHGGASFRVREWQPEPPDGLLTRIVVIPEPSSP